MGSLNPPAVSEAPHIPALVSEILSVFPEDFRPEKILDCTFGGGGHSLALLKKFPAARIMALDRDLEAMARGASLKPVKEGKIQLIHGNFHDFAARGSGKASMRGQDQLLDSLLRERFDIILMDLGASSPQLDQTERGFSFYQNGPLDMRMDREQKLTAANIVNQFSKKELARLFQEYGEIKNPFPVVDSIFEQRRKKKLIQTTGELAAIIQKRGPRRFSSRRRFSGKHPATAYFLALRMKVNNELDGLRQSLPGFMAALKRSGYFLVVSFHSLEDRIVKRAFRSYEERGGGKILSKKVIRPSLEEKKANPRCRSAKLRALVKNTG